MDYLSKSELSRYSGLVLLIATCALVAPVAAESVVAERACVILLHGLARSQRSMEKLEGRLQQAGYVAVNVDYPSRENRVQQLADPTISGGLEICRANSATPVHFITHSMGGILVRYYLATNTLPDLGRVVMLSPPNQGSEVVDKLGTMAAFNTLNGPAGQQIGTSENSVPVQLGAVQFPLGVITGNRSVNLILSALIPGPDDGKVGVDKARVDGMRDFLVVPYSHPFIMQRDPVIEQAMHFLAHGKFHKHEEVVDEP